MLEFAKLYEDVVNFLLRRTCTEEKYKFTQPSYIEPIRVDESDWSRIQRVSTFNGNVLAFFQATIDRGSNIVNQITILSFKTSSLQEKKSIRNDLLNFLLYLLENFKKVKFSCCTENPVINKYIKLVDYLFSRPVGVYREELLINGKYYDEMLFEIISSEKVIKELKKLIDTSYYKANK